MKKAIILIFLLFLITEFTFAHDGEIHKYIVYRAYQLLEKRYIEAGGSPQDLQEMKSKILNSDGTQCNENNDPNHPIVRGAFQEDVDDPIYHYIKGVTVTQTHFWNADEGENQLNWITDKPNAYMKTKAYIFSNEKNYTWKVVFFSFVYLPVVEYIYSINTSLIDFYLTGVCERNLIAASLLINSETVTYNDAKRVSYEILGRVAHLLADMSVPAHTLNDDHFNILGIGDPDPYEYLYFRVEGKKLFITEDNLINDDGFMPFLVNNYNDATIMKTLYYTMNQLSSHFPSKDKSGNNTVPANTDLIEQKLIAWGTPKSFQSTDMIDIAKKTFNFCVGATATLFYWFGIRTSMLQTQIKDMNFNCSLPNPTLTIHTDNSITLLPGFEFTGTDMLLTTEPKASSGSKIISVSPEYAPNTTIVFDSIPQNIPVDTIYVND